MSNTPTFDSLPEQVQILIEEIKELKSLILKIKFPLPEEYLTPDEMAKTLKISTVTLWSWDKKGITKPCRIGNLKRYRRSDLNEILIDVSKADQ